MTEQAVVETLQHRPFVPLCVRLNDGRSLTIQHHQLAQVGCGVVIVFHLGAGQSPPMFERYECVPLSSVERIEPLPSSVDVY